MVRQVPSVSQRIVIAGVPRAGKTTLSKRYESVLHTDDMRHLPWSEHSAVVADWLDEPGPWVIEGVAAVRALRKWLRSREGKPCDRVIWLDTPHVELTDRQQRLAAGCRTVWRGIQQELRQRGVELEAWQ